MKKQIIWIITALILVALLLIIMNFKKSEADADSSPSLPADFEDFDESPESSYYVVEEDLIPLTSENILGTWKAISEQTGIDGVVNNNPKNSEITFSEEIYLSTTFGIPESGYYQLKENQIIFYNSKEDFNKQGNFLIAEGGIRDNTLRITFPQFPKTVVYEKVE